LAACIHHVQASLFPNWVGVSQERFFEFNGERLVFSTPPLQVAGKQQTSHLIWELLSKLDGKLWV
jgi:hypothetical protein